MLTKIKCWVGMRVKFLKHDSFLFPSIHRFGERVRDLGDYAILIAYWDIRIFKNDNPWKNRKAL